MRYLEKDIEDLLHNLLKENNQDKLNSLGFDALIANNDITWHRQPKFGGYGIGDLMGVSASKAVDVIDNKSFEYDILMIQLIEIKNEPLKSRHIDQVLRYKKAIDDYMLNHFCDNEQLYMDGFYKFNDWEIESYLIAPSIEGGHYILNEMIRHESPINLYTFDVNIIDGITFYKEEGTWSVKDKKFDNFVDFIPISSGEQTLQ